MRKYNTKIRLNKVKERLGYWKREAKKEQEKKGVISRFTKGYWMGREKVLANVEQEIDDIVKTMEEI